MSDRPLLQDPRFDLADFHRRWACARKAALTAALAVNFIGDEASESDLVLRVEPAHHDALLRAVFDQSRKLGLSLSRGLRLSLQTGDLEDLFRTSGIRCFKGEWTRRRDVRVLRRAGCDPEERSAIVCAYWREAADGLVMGAGEEERYVRHRNVVHGDSECEDVLFSEEFADPSRRQGPIPRRLAAGLAQLQTLFRSVYRVDLLFLGYSDGALSYQLKSDAGAGCGPGARLLEQVLLRKLETLYPDLRAYEASPRAIFGGSGLADQG